MSIARFASYNLLGQTIPIVVALATTPILVSIVGLERYGILSICWLLLGYFGVLDLGLTKAAMQRIAALRDAPDEARAEVFWTVCWANAGLAVIAVGVVTPLLMLGFDIQQMTPGVRGELDETLPWLSAIVGLSILVAPWGATMVARERFGLYNLVDGASNIAMSLVPLLAAILIGPRLEVLVAASLAVRAVASAIYLSAAVRVVPLGKIARPKGEVARSLAVYGGWATAIGVIGPLLWNWDRFAIGAVLGAAAVSIYVIPFQLVWRLAVVPGALASALFPRLSSGDLASAEALQSEAMKALLSIMTPLVVVAIAFVEPFLRLWLGQDLGSQGRNVAHFLLPGLWINAIAQIGITVLLARDRPRTVAVLHLSELVPYVATLYISMLLFGIEGAAIAWTLRVSIDAIIMLRISTGSFAFSRLLTVPGVLVCAAAVVSVLMSWTSPGRWIALLGLVALALAWSLKTAPPQVSRLMRRVLPAAAELSRLRSGK